MSYRTPKDIKIRCNALGKVHRTLFPGEISISEEDQAQGD